MLNNMYVICNLWYCVRSGWKSTSRTYSYTENVWIYGESYICDMSMRAQSTFTDIQFMTSFKYSSPNILRKLRIILALYEFTAGTHSISEYIFCRAFPLLIFWQGNYLDWSISIESLAAACELLTLDLSLFVVWLRSSQTSLHSIIFCDWNES